MAVKANETTKLVLKVETGVNAKGAAVYSQRTIGNINPALSDADMLDIGNAIAGLQSCPLGGVVRQDSANLEA